MNTCPACGSEVPTRVGPGRPAVYCSKRCGTRARVARHRARQLPSQMGGRRWVRADGKRPIRVDGRAASTTDPSTWAKRDEVLASTAGDGLGVMLGGGLGCYDLDHVTDMQVRAFLATVSEPVVFVERSVSGNGVHVFIEAPEAPGWRRVVDGVSVERYSRARFIRFTGDRVAV